MASSSTVRARDTDFSEQIKSPSKQELNPTTLTPPQIALQTEISNEPTVTPGQPTEQLQLEEPAEDDIEYPKGPQLWLNMVSVLLVCFLHGLDLTIVAVTIPSLTNEFKTLDDIGWYSAVYGVIFSSTNFFFGKMYTLFDLRTMYIVSVVIFELGSVLCTFAPSSKVFILGRAVAGFGAAGQGAGAMAFIPRCFPIHKRPIINGFLGFAQSLGLVTAPIIGGALTDAFSWRACFGINVPIGVVAVAITAIWMKEAPHTGLDHDLPIRQKLQRLDPIGTLLILPCIVCLMMGLQWGGSRYGWGDWRIILLFVLFVALVIGFAYVQHRQQDKAILPPRILKNRTVLATALYSCCLNGLLAVTEYYIAIYFQGVRGYTATRAGILGLPMIAGLALSSILSAFGTTWVGYYTRKSAPDEYLFLTYAAFMFATSICAPIATGLLTTIDLDDSPAKVAGLLGFIGVAVGFGIQQPVTATMTVVSQKEMSIAIGVLIFGSGIGSALFVAASATLFQSRLAEEVSKYAPGTNVTTLGHAGLAEIRKVIGSDRLKDVLFGYNEAVVQTLYLPVGLALLTVVGSAFTEIKSVKKKRE